MEIFKKVPPKVLIPTGLVALVLVVAWLNKNGDRFYPAPSYIPAEYILTSDGNRTYPLVFSGGGCEVLWCPGHKGPSSLSYHYSCPRVHGRYTIFGFSIDQMTHDLESEQRKRLESIRKEWLNARTRPNTPGSYASKASLILQEPFSLETYKGYFHEFSYVDTFASGKFNGELYELSLNTPRATILLSTDSGCIPKENAKNEMMKILESMLTDTTS
jgi:hypothetical protein